MLKVEALGLLEVGFREFRAWDFGVGGIGGSRVSRVNPPKP